MKVYSRNDVVGYITNKYYVYGLVDPVTKKIFYIGKGFRLRLFDHVGKMNIKIAAQNRSKKQLA